MARVLVAENDTDERDLMAFRLEQAGFDVQTCRTGDAVLDAIDPDVVALVLQERLRGLSGLEVCGRVRSTPEFADLPVLLVSTSGAEEEALAAFTAGADDWLVEPLHAWEFETRLRSLVQRCHRHPHRRR